ncbi:MAG TPA: sporulation protein YabP [Candidatus Gallacutalibacter stercoravium]|nr:sporulation protein YabP [Candidatus Gallacutalibacter stercoravium]
MADEKKSTKMPHSIIMENRKLLTATGVSDVDSFDEQSVTAYTDLGELSIRGNGLHISKLNVETGDLTIEGEIISLTYSENRSSSGGLLSKLFR